MTDTQRTRLDAATLDDDDAIAIELQKTGPTTTELGRVIPTPSGEWMTDAERAPWEEIEKLRAQRDEAQAELARVRAVVKREIAYCEEPDLPCSNVRVSHVKSLIARRLRDALGRNEAVNMNKEKTYEPE